MRAPVSIWLVEDNDPFRGIVERLLNDTPGFVCPHAFSASESALRMLGRSRPDVILMDVSLPGMDGISAIGEIKTRAPETHVVMLTVFEDREKISRAISAGASGYLLKTSPEEEIVSAVREVVEGGVPMNQEVARSVWRLLAQLTGRPKAGGLTPRETEILRLTARGLGNKETAARLSVSEHTVDAHLRNIYQKLGVRSRAAAVAAALQKRLV